MTTTSRFTATALAALLTTAPVAAFAQATGPSTTGGTTSAPPATAPSASGSATTSAPAPATAAQSGGHSQRVSQATLESAQQELQQQGYYGKNAKVDGRWGPRTRHAVRNYQQAKGLPVTGKLDQQTLSSLGVHGS